MSARVMNPALMTEMSSKLSAIVASGGAATTQSSAGASAGRVGPSRAALARVRRDLFGPVDHSAARAYAEQEMRAQSLLDSERWGFDFRLELPKADGKSRFEWKPIGHDDLVPEPYVLRGMPYLRKQSPATPARSPPKSTHGSPRSPRSTRSSRSSRSPRARSGSSCESSPVCEAASLGTAAATTLTPCLQDKMQLSERTPPQEARVPPVGEKTPDVLPAVAELTVRSTPSRSSPLAQQPITPVLSARKQAAITDFMKSRKRTLNASTKSMVEPAEKVSRNAGQIRS